MTKFSAFFIKSGTPHYDSIQKQKHTPIIFFVEDGEVEVDLSFTGSMSVNGMSQDTLTYTWDFGDGGTATGLAPTHIYSAEGVYLASVQVVDADGALAIDRVEVTVIREEPAPVVVSADPEPEPEGSTDPEPEPTPEPDPVASRALPDGDRPSRGL